MSDCYMINNWLIYKDIRIRLSDVSYYEHKARHTHIVVKGQSIYQGVAIPDGDKEVFDKLDDYFLKSEKNI